MYSTPQCSNNMLWITLPLHVRLSIVMCFHMTPLSSVGAAHGFRLDPGENKNILFAYTRTNNYVVILFIIAESCGVDEENIDCFGTAIVKIKANDKLLDRMICCHSCSQVVCGREHVSAITTFFPKTKMS